MCVLIQITSLSDTCSLGQIVEIKPRKVHRKFAVHENLLCKTSEVFKQRLQEHRKPVERDCPICHENLDPAIADITYCQVKCGKNLHQHCLDKWEHAQSEVITCPMCREAWEDHTTLDLASNTDLGPKAMQLYMDWLYSGGVHINQEIALESDDFNVLHLKAWVVSHAVGDTTFQTAIGKMPISNMQEGTSLVSVQNPLTLRMRARLREG